MIGSDETWKTSTGAYTYNNIYSGDKFDARLEEAGWKTAHFDDSKWEAALPAQAPAPLLVAQQMPGIRITEEVRPVSMKRFSDQLYVYSFPKNMSGLCRLKVKGEAGTRITLKHGELLKKDGRLEQGNINILSSGQTGRYSDGCLYLERYGRGGDLHAFLLLSRFPIRGGGE